MYVPQSMFNKKFNSFFIFYIFFRLKIMPTQPIDPKFRKLSFDTKKIFFSFPSGYISEIWIVSLLLDISKILWKKF